MAVYIALFRGINVGGKNIIRMAALKQVMESIGLSSVKTVIQSGNVLFQSQEAEEPLGEKIEQAIEANFHIPAKVVLRTSAELAQLVANCPFPPEQVREAEVASGVESLYVALLAHRPYEEGIASIDGYSGEDDQYQIVGRDVYLLFRHSIRNSKLANHLGKLNVPTTVRNWKTVNKLAELATEIESAL